MLSIRSEQIQVLNEQMLARFVEQMENHLRSAFPETVDRYPGSNLRSLIHEGIAVASRYDITDAADVERYLEFVMRHGPDFHQTQPWARSVLNDADLGGSEKLNRLDDCELFEKDLASENMEAG